MQDTWNYIVIKFSAMQLHPNLKNSDLNVQGDPMTPSKGEIGLNKIQTKRKEGVKNAPKNLNIIYGMSLFK